MSKKDDLIGSDHALSKGKRANLDLVLDLIVPPGTDGRLPGASEVGVAAYLAVHTPEALPGIGDALDRLDAEAHARFGSGFAALEPDSQRALVAAMRAADPTFLSRLAQITVVCYYQHDRVLTGLGLEARPPFPQGHTVASGDLSLLDPVRARGRIYRET